MDALGETTVNLSKQHTSTQNTHFSTHITFYSKKLFLNKTTELNMINCYNWWCRLTRNILTVPTLTNEKSDDRFLANIHLCRGMRNYL